jgi:glutathione S-transferase
MSDLMLYTNPWSRGRVARWMLEEVGRPYDVRVLAYGEDMKAPAYLAINPMGKVPALVHDGAVVTEGAAICAYLADVFPEAGLGPRPEEKAAYYRWLFFGAGPVEAAAVNASLGVEVSAEKQRMVGYGSLAHVMDALEGVLSRTSYLAGERFTAADVYTGSAIVWNVHFGAFEARPVFSDYIARVTERDAFRRAAALDDAEAERMGHPPQG